MTRFLQNNGGLNRWAITGVLLKTRDKHIIKNCTTENKKNNEFSKNKLIFKTKSVFPLTKIKLFFKVKIHENGFLSNSVGLLSAPASAAAIQM